MFPDESFFKQLAHSFIQAFCHIFLHCKYHRQNSFWVFTLEMKCYLCSLKDLRKEDLKYPNGTGFFDLFFDSFTRFNLLLLFIIHLFGSSDHFQNKGFLFELNLPGFWKHCLLSFFDWVFLGLVVQGLFHFEKLALGLMEVDYLESFPICFFKKWKKKNRSF